MEVDSACSLGKALHEPLFDIPCSYADSVLRWLTAADVRVDGENQNKVLGEFFPSLVFFFLSRSQEVVEKILFLIFCSSF